MILGDNHPMFLDQGLQRMSPLPRHEAKLSTILGECMLSRIEFNIPFLPTSMNAIYNVMFHLRRIELKPECRLFKTKCKEYIPLFKASGESKSGLIKVAMHFTYNFYYKNCKMKNVDTQNMMKLVIDSIAEKIGIGDNYFKSGAWTSEHSDTVESVQVVLEELE